MLLAQQLINGLLLGSVYALIAIGYTLVFGTLRFLNLAHGEVFMAAGYVGVIVLRLYSGFPVWGAILVAGLAAALLGVVLRHACFRTARSAHHLAPVLSTVGFGMMVTGTITNNFGPDPLIIPSLSTGTDFNFGGVLISGVQVVVLLVSCALLVGLTLFVRSTSAGRGIRAIAENLHAAQLLGVNVDRLITVTFAVSAGLAGAASMLVAVRTASISPAIAGAVGLKALAIMAIGGLGSLPGALSGGILLGMAEVMTVAYGPARFSELLVWLVLIIILIVKPSGLFATRAS